MASDARLPSHLNASFFSIFVYIREGTAQTVMFYVILNTHEKLNVILNMCEKLCFPPNNVRHSFQGILRLCGCVQVPNSSPRIISDSATISQQQSITAGSGGSRASGSRLGSGHGSIMDAQHQELGGGGGGGAGRLSQRERDRLRLQETKRKEVVTSESEEPRIPSAEEREQIRKHRQAYFASQDAKKKATASSSLTSRQEGRVTENQHTVKVVDTKRGEQQAASLGSPDTVESRHQTSKTRESKPQPSKTTPEATKLAEDEAKGSVSKPTLRSSGANSVMDDRGKEQKRRAIENSEQVQRKTVGTEERKKEKRQSQQKYSGSVSTVDTGKGTSFQPVTQPQFNAKDRASASGIYIHIT